MNLYEAIERLDALDPEATIYASRPFSEHSTVVIAVDPDEGGLPVEASSLGLSYFLEVDVAQEVVEGWKMELDHDPETSETCERVIYYAINDA